jgi:hypothetical protein
MKRLLLLTGMTAALVAPAAAHADVGPLARHQLCGASCASFHAQGGGTLTQGAYGVTWGTVGRGTIRITDLSDNGRRDFRVLGARRHTTKGRVHVYQGADLRFLAYSRWKVSVVGIDVDISTVARGWAYVRGAGRYHLNGASRAHGWPRRGATLQLRR